MPRLQAIGIALMLMVSAARGDGPADNLPENVRRIPAIGIEPSPDDREEITIRLDELEKAIRRLRTSKDARIQELLPDVIIFHKAVNDALRFREFFAAGDVKKAKTLLVEGRERATRLEKGEAPWTEQTGLVVRGYVSKIDDSVQPFGIVVPPSYNPRTAGRYRLDLWFHGRGETLSEVNFLHDRRTNPGTFTPADTLVLHPYGRYCNAAKLAGEVDALEALAAAKRMYRVDDDRVSVRGFSMGGASAWQFAVHYPDLWFAANPGAGFSETPRFLKVFQRETLTPTWYEQKLWNLYDCDKWAMNLRGLPVVAYSGELDNQKQAADVMAEALGPQGIELTHVIGPQTKHAYHPESKIVVESKLAALAARGRESNPRAVDFITYTLRYNRNAWVQVDAMTEHWSEARVSARIVETADGGVELGVETKGVEALTLDFGPGRAPFRAGGPRPRVKIDGVEVAGPAVRSDQSWRMQLSRGANGWKTGEAAPAGLVKRHGLQGPIDDAFLSRFIFVLPTGRCPHPQIAAWVEAESARAIEHWRRHFRGEAIVKKDVDVTSEDMKSANLVLWGDPSSNTVLAKLADRLPIAWKSDGIVAGSERWDAADHVLIAIHPNPDAPDRYVVLNSGFTFREYDYLNNARQVPKLPDWAVIDVKTKPNARFPGKVVAADFFDETWKLIAPRRGLVEAR
ncbi:MAG: prolyl oligopeptidase family serine peptidase [Isosphaeraceae bacterium]|nr:prolyl oligopeptidase family serine peptidase [Isosphaeraceae bacterium]